MLNAEGLYVVEDIAFCNTNQFNEAARFFKKHGVYTFAPSDSREFKEHWDIEEDRLKNGMSAPGKLQYIDGKPIIQDVHITGEHYGFLNYGRIIRTKDDDTDELKNVVKDSHLLNKARKIGKKDLDFPSFLDGQYHWMKAKEFAKSIGLNVVMAKARRKGFSYMEGWDCALTTNMNPYSTTLIAAYDYKYLIKGNQILSMSKRYLDFLELHTDFGRGYIKEAIDHIKLGYKKPNEGNKEFGYQSQIIGVSCMDNPDALAGKDALLIKFEETGKFPNLKETLDITLSTTEDGSIITGFITLFGTGGTDEANWAAFEEIYWNPELYNCMVFDNIWSEGSKGKGVGFFYPQSVGDPAFVDEHGNSLREQAKAANNRKREDKKKKITQSAYVKYVGQRAETPEEAFASGNDNIFPAADIMAHESKLKHDPDYKYLHRAGQLVYTDKGIKFRLNEELKLEGLTTHDPVFEYPINKATDVVGTYVEWISPYRDRITGKIPKGLYRVWHDPYAQDKDSKKITMRDSLGATYVYEKTNNVTPGRGDYLVASFVGRPNTMDAYNEVLLKIAEYWNAEIMFENDRGDVKQYAANKRKLHLLANEPDVEWEAELKGKVNRGKGINMTTDRKAKGAIYLRDWLVTPRGLDRFGNPRMNLHYIYDPALCSELRKWNNKGNFDRVSALIVGMFDAKEQFHKEIEIPQVANSNDFFNRPLFTN